MIFGKDSKYKINKKTGLYEIENIGNPNLVTILLIKSIKALKNTSGINFEAHSERLATLHEFCSPKKIKEITQKRFQIINESMKMKSVNKTRLAGLNDKRYSFHDRIVSLPFGYLLLEKS